MIGLRIAKIKSFGFVLTLVLMLYGVVFARAEEVSSERALFCKYESPSNVTALASHRYLVVDLSGGCDAEHYPVGWVAYDSKVGWPDEYKTTKLVLRRINPGSYIVGENKTNEANRATFKRSFYIGVFEVTQRQWELVMGTRPSKFNADYEKRPVENVSFDKIRTLKWPGISDVDANSFLGKLRKRTGLPFDVPCEAHWEYACFAGLESDCSLGKIPDGKYMWYRENSSNQTHEVGLKLPNRWGLFDMHGNVSEWCLDPTPIVVNPICYLRNCRMIRGGNWSMNKYSHITFDGKMGLNDRCDDKTGFRVFLDFKVHEEY